MRGRTIPIVLSTMRFKSTSWRCEFGLARALQEAFDDLFDLGDLAVDDVEALHQTARAVALDGIRRDLLAQKLKVPADRVERRADLVREARGQLAHDGELLACS